MHLNVCMIQKEKEKHGTMKIPFGQKENSPMIYSPSGSTQALTDLFEQFIHYTFSTNLSQDSSFGDIIRFEWNRPRGKH